MADYQSRPGSHLAFHYKQAVMEINAWTEEQKSLSAKTVHSVLTSVG